MTDLPDLQLALRPGCIDFGWGHPAGALLPLAELRDAAAGALGADGALALGYGAAQGPGRLIAPLCTHIGRIDARVPAPERLLITGGISQALDMLCTLYTRPGDVALVESPVYHLALRILRDHDLQLWPVATDEEGLRLDALAEALERARRAGRPARLLYTVPTFTNPTGRCLGAERRAVLVDLALQHNVLVLEDDVYRELWYDAPPPPPLAAYSAMANVVRLGSFAKILAPGLRLGWVLAGEAVVRRCVESGMLDSGGGVNHFTAHIVAEYLRRELLDAHVARLRAAYGERRDRLVAALRRYLPVECRFRAPGGGYFVWIQAPDGVDTSALLPRAEAAGVSYLPGTLFHSDGGGQSYLRLAFSLLALDELEEGARRLGAVLGMSGCDGPAQC